jgi:hypothetical protein
MPISYQELTQLTCPHCHHEFARSVWLVIDFGEHPELRSYGLTNRETCPNCQYEAEIDTTLLIREIDLSVERLGARNPKHLTFHPHPASTAYKAQNFQSLMQELEKETADRLSTVAEKRIKEVFREAKKQIIINEEQLNHLHNSILAELHGLPTPEKVWCEDWVPHLLLSITPHYFNSILRLYIDTILKKVSEKIMAPFREEILQELNHLRERFWPIDRFLERNFSALPQETTVAVAKSEAKAGEGVVVLSESFGPVGIVEPEVLSQLPDEDSLMVHQDQFSSIIVTHSNVTVIEIVTIMAKYPVFGSVVAVDNGKIAGFVLQSKLLGVVGLAVFDQLHGDAGKTPPICYRCTKNPHNLISDNQVQTKNVQGNPLCPYDGAELTLVYPCPKGVGQ